METLKINPKILAAVFASVMIIADLVPASNLGPGLILSSYRWAASRVEWSQETHQANQRGTAQRSQLRNSSYNQ